MPYIAKKARQAQAASVPTTDLPLIVTWALAGLVVTAAMALWATPAAMLMIAG